MERRHRDIREKEEVLMSKNKVIGVLLAILAVATMAGMVIENDTFWRLYNYTTVILSAIGSLILLKGK